MSMLPQAAYATNTDAHPDQQQKAARTLTLIAARIGASAEDLHTALQHVGLAPAPPQVLTKSCGHDSSELYRTAMHNGIQCRACRREWESTKARQAGVEARRAAKE